MTTRAYSMQRNTLPMGAFEYMLRNPLCVNADFHLMMPTARQQRTYCYPAVQATRRYYLSRLVSSPG